MAERSLKALRGVKNGFNRKGKEVKTIGIDDTLAEKAARMGWPGKGASEPDIDQIVGRYEYGPLAGVFIGPSGKVLTPHYSPWAKSWRVGLYVDGRAVSVNIGRLAFALTHWRWPVAVWFKNGDMSDARAENLSECASGEFRSAEKTDRWPGTALAVVEADPFGEGETTGPDPFKPQDRRGAVYGSKDVFAERRRIIAALKSERLTWRDRKKLEFYKLSFDARCQACEGAVKRDLDGLKGRQGEKQKEDAAKPRHRRKVTGPAKSIRRAARFQKMGAARLRG